MLTSTPLMRRRIGPGSQSNYPRRQHRRQTDHFDSFSPAEEIGTYFKDVAKRHDIYPLITFESTVVGATWDDTAGKWKVQVSNTSGQEQESTADLVVNAGGILNDWKWPEIEGLKDFKGVLMHTACWVRQRPGTT